MRKTRNEAKIFWAQFTCQRIAFYFGEFCSISRLGVLTLSEVIMELPRFVRVRREDWERGREVVENEIWLSSNRFSVNERNEIFPPEADAP